MIIPTNIASNIEEVKQRLHSFMKDVLPLFKKLMKEKWTIKIVLLILLRVKKWLDLAMDKQVNSSLGMLKTSIREIG